MAASSAAPTKPRVRRLSTRWMVRMSACWNSPSLEASRTPCTSALSGVRFWLQAITSMPKACPTRAISAPNVAETEDAQSLAFKAVTDSALPTAGTERSVFGDDVAGARQYQSPGQLDGGAEVVAGMHHAYFALGGCRDVDRGVSEGGGSDQPQSGQTFDDRPRQRRPLPHDTYDVERQEPFGDAVGVGKMVIEDRDGRSPIEASPIGHFQRDLLIGIQDGDVTNIPPLYQTFRPHSGPAAA